MYKHDSSEEASPTNSNDSQANKKPPAQPDIEEGVRVKESKSQETDINVQSSSSCRGVRLQAVTVATLVYSLIQRVLMTISVLTFFSGVRIEIGEFCNNLTEVPCC